MCNSWIHQRCSGLSEKDIVEFDTEIEWMWPKCSRYTFPFWNLNDQELAENFTSSEHNFLHKLEPFEYSENKFLINNRGIDGDLNFTDNMSIECKYYSLEAFSKNLSGKNSSSIVYFNIRSIKANFQNLLIHLEIITHEFDVIAITETWLSEDERDLFEIENNTSNFVSRKSGRGEGVGIYVKSGIQYKVLTNLCVNPSNCEFIAIEIDYQAYKNSIVGRCTTPPNSNTEDFTKILEDLTSLDRIRK